MKKSKAQAVRKYITRNPDALLREVCAATKTSYAYVCTIRSQIKKENWKHLTTVSSNTPIDTVTDTTPERMEELVFQATQGRDRSKEPQADNVNHPAHYKVGGIETIDFIEAKQLNYNLGNVVKYITRADTKGNREEDLLKARWYLNRELATFEKEAA